MSRFTQLAEWLSPRAKAFVAGAAPVVMLLIGLGRDGGLSWDDWQLIVEVGLASAGVTYAVPNVPRKPPTR